MRDGTRLATDVYLPTSGRAWPVLLARVPYDKAGAECMMPACAAWFTERGFAVVLQDVRGKVRSDGGTAPFVSESVDGYDTIEWITNQPWFRSGVAMFGDSYFGWTQWAAAESGHPALRAIVPRVTTSDFTAVTTYQGVVSLELAALWAVETWVDEWLYDAPRLEWAAPLGDVATRALDGRRSVYFDALVAGRQSRAARLDVTGRVPTLHLGGWWDLMSRGQLATWRAARRHAPKSVVHPLVMDSVDHGWTQMRRPNEPYVDPHAEECNLTDYLERYLAPMVPFLRHHLKDATLEAFAAVRWHDFNGGEGLWRSSDEWPPPDAGVVELQLIATSAGGALAAPSESRQHRAGWVDSPRDPYLGRRHPYHPLVDPVDEGSPARAQGGVTFDSDPMSRPMTLAGLVTVTGRVSSTGHAANLTAELIDIEPSGYGRRLVDGALCVRPPWPSSYSLNLGEIGYTLPAGHRLRLELGCGEFPRYLPQAPPDVDPWFSDPREWPSSEVSLHLGGSSPTMLSLHVLASRGTEGKP